MLSCGWQRRLLVLKTGNVTRRSYMLDVIVVLVTIVSFVAFIAFTGACERL